MNPTRWMLLLVPGLLLVWLAYDLLVVLWLQPRLTRRGLTDAQIGRQCPTITRETQRLSREYPAIPFLAGLILGLLAGHFYGNF